MSDPLPDNSAIRQPAKQFQPNDAAPSPLVPEQPTPRKSMAKALSPGEALAALQAELGTAPSAALSGYLPEAGQVVDQYRVLEKIGHGGMGAVYKAEDLKLSRLVALKVLPVGPVDEHKLSERFLREAQCLARLNHPNLVHIYNVGAGRGFHYFAMELLHGATLSSIIRKRTRLPAEEALAIIGQIVSALQYIHGQGILHRDIKSGNIMVCSNRAVLMDFGLAKDEQGSALTSVGVMLGTPEFMAPEQAEGETCGPVTDIYSLGIVLYQAISGTVPFKGRSALAVIRRHLEELPTPLTECLPGVDLMLSRIVLRCLAKRPADRYPDCVTLAKELVQVHPTPELVQLAGLSSQSAWINAAETATRRLNEPFGAQTLTQTMQGAAHSPSGTPHSSAPIGRPVASASYFWKICAVICVILLFILTWHVAINRPARVVGRAVPLSGLTGKEEYRMLEFRRENDDPRTWRYIVQRKTADGNWQHEVLTQAEMMALTAD